MNPSKMRNTYGKMIYILMDTESPTVKNELKIDFVKPVLTVYNFLHDKELTDILNDPLWIVATKILDTSNHQYTRTEIDRLQQEKKQAIEKLLEKYTSGNRYTISTISCVSKKIHYCVIVIVVVACR